jgi:hypothetical protein
MTTRPLTSFGLLIVRRSCFDVVLARGFALDETLGWLEVYGCHFSTAVLLEVIAYALILMQRPHSGAFNRADVNEGIVTATIRRDEPIAFAIIKKLDGSGCHFTSFCCERATCDRSFSNLNRRTIALAFEHCSERQV